jgi:hypothetical protein
MLGCLSVLSRGQVPKDGELLVRRTRPDLEAVPDRPSPRHPRGRLRPRGHRAAPPRLRDGRHRARHPPCSPGRHHRAPGWCLDDTVSPQPPDGPGPASGYGQVPDQGQGRPVRQLFRCRVRCGRHQDRGQPARADSPNDRSTACRPVDRRSRNAAAPTNGHGQSENAEPRIGTASQLVVLGVRTRRSIYLGVACMAKSLSCVVSLASFL